MEEEINYSTVVFKNGDPPLKEKKEDLTIYSEVKPKAPASTAPNGEAAAHSHFRALAACLGILSVLLVASIGAIIWISVQMHEQSVNLSRLRAANQQLNTERSSLERQAAELSRTTDNLNWTLRVILKFKTFPVNEYCPDKNCRPCQNDWIHFQEKCYLFYKEDPPWKTWTDSRKYCQSITADLVVIDSPEEQKFISNHSTFYYDREHGYWFGLHQEDGKNWLWVDGRNDTLSYWMKTELGTPGSCALIIPNMEPTASWDPADCVMLNRFICESEALIRSY